MRNRETTIQRSRIDRCRASSSRCAGLSVRSFISPGSSAMFSQNAFVGSGAAWPPKNALGFCGCVTLGNVGLFGDNGASEMTLLGSTTIVGVMLGSVGKPEPALLPAPPVPPEPIAALPPAPDAFPMDVIAPWRIGQPVTAGLVAQWLRREFTGLADCLQGHGKSE